MAFSPERDCSLRVLSISLSHTALIGEWMIAGQPEWVQPEIVVRLRHLKGGDTLRHASVQGIAKERYVWSKWDTITFDDRVLKTLTDGKGSGTLFNRDALKSEEQAENLSAVAIPIRARLVSCRR